MVASNTRRLLQTLDVGEVVAILGRAERRLTGLAESLHDEDLIASMRSVLGDLALARLRLEGASGDDARASPRIHARAMLCLRLPGGSLVETELYDISAGGALVACEGTLAGSEQCEVEIDGLLGKITAAIKPAPGGRCHLIFQGLDADRTLALTKHLDRSFFRF